MSFICFWTFVIGALEWRSARGELGSSSSSAPTPASPAANVNEIKKLFDAELLSKNQQNAVCKFERFNSREQLTLVGSAALTSAGGIVVFVIIILCMRTCAWLYECRKMCVRVSAYLCVFVRLYLCVRLCACLCVFVLVCECVCVCAVVCSLCISIYFTRFTYLMQCCSLRRRKMIKWAPRGFRNACRLTILFLFILTFKVFYAHIFIHLYNFSYITMSNIIVM